MRAPEIRGMGRSSSPAWDLRRIRCAEVRRSLQRAPPGGREEGGSPNTHTREKMDAYSSVSAPPSFNPQSQEVSVVHHLSCTAGETEA